MAGDKEILNKIRSVKNMQKITSAMEMVAASKIRKAQDQMQASRPYAERIRKNNHNLKRLIHLNNQKVMINKKVIIKIHNQIIQMIVIVKIKN